MKSASSRCFLVCSVLAVAFALDGCQSVSSPAPPPKSPPPPSISVTIHQPSTSVPAGTTAQFSATVTGATNPAVSWSVDTVAGGNADTGLIDATGVYHAPATAGSHTITAISVADTTKSASASITVANTSSLSPTSATLIAGATQQFTASFPDLSNPSIVWSVDNIPGGNSTVGVITTAGLYTAPSQAGTHTVGVADANTGVSDSASLAIFTMSTSPTSATVAPSGTLQFNATIQGLRNTDVTWTVDGVVGGNSTVGTITSAGLYTAPFALGPHTITGASPSAPSSPFASYLTVTNTSAGAVLTFHNDDARDGAFTEETTLTPANVNSSQFGKLFSYPVDGQIYAQPLFVPQLSIGGAAHNVVFVATENDTVYAFDADGSQTTPLWSTSLGIPSPRNDVYGISPQLGITSTPVIDITTNTLYVLAETNSGPFYLHALDVTSGAEKFGGPVSVTASVPGTGWDSTNGTITLEKGCYQRVGLALDPVTNMVYIAFGHCNHGWVLAYDKTSLLQTAVFNATPDGAGGGLWSGAPAIEDLSGDIYLITGVDQNDPSSGFNDSFLRLSASDLSEQDFFQPDNESWLDANDADLGSGGAILLPDNTSSTPREVIGGGKDGRVFVVNRDNMGNFAPDSNNVIQTVQVGVRQFDNIFSTPVYWNGFLYYHCDDDSLKAYSWNNGLLSTEPASSATPIYGMHGATASLSANGTSNGIIWDLDNSTYGTGPAVLHAYDASNLTTELYNSSQAGTRDTAGIALKLTVPTIADGKVFVGTSNELDIYGLLAP